jgi:ADP-heptose:LPS heptosyltransferase
MRILFITATRVGDAVLSTAVLDEMLRRAPEARFTIACGPAASGLFTRFPALERLIVVEKRKYDLHWALLWSKVSRINWRCVVDLRGSAISLFVPTRHRVIVRGGRRPGHRLHHLAAAIGFDPPPMPVAWTNEEDRALAARLIPPGGTVIGLGPTANWDGKIWPAANFAALFRRVSETALPGARPVVFGGPGAKERAIAAPLLAALPGAIDLCGKLSLPQAAACLARCDLFAGNDSGLMHLAAAAGAPTLGLFGPTSADEYAPKGRRTAVALAGTASSPAPIETLTVAAALRAAWTLVDVTTAERASPPGLPSDDRASLPC